MFFYYLEAQRDISLQYAPAYSIAKMSSSPYNYLICHILYSELYYILLTYTLNIVLLFSIYIQFVH